MSVHKMGLESVSSDRFAVPASMRAKFDRLDIDGLTDAWIRHAELSGDTAVLGYIVRNIEILSL